MPEPQRPVEQKIEATGEVRIEHVTQVVIENLPLGLRVAVRARLTVARPFCHGLAARAGWG